MICTECFTLLEIELLINILKDKYNLIATINKRSNKGFRIRFSSKKSNIELLRSLVSSHFHPSMLYKLGINLGPL
jgi:hypothetical protein